MHPATRSKPIMRSDKPPTTATAGSASSPRSLCVYLALLFALVPLWPGSEAIGAALVLVAVVASWRELKPVPRAVLVLVVGGALLALAFDPRLLLRAAVAAARLSALVIAVMLLSATLGRSRGAEELATGLMRGRALPRYLGIAAATGVLALPLNFGSVALMCTVIRRAMLRSGDSAPVRNAARAAMRGFGAASLGSPLSISLSVTLTLLPGSTAQGLLAISVPFACFFLLLGVAFREAEPASAAAPGIEAVAGGPASAWRGWLRFAVWLAAICMAAFTLYGAFGMPYARAVSIACVGAAIVSLGAAWGSGDKAGPPPMGSTGNELAVMSGSAFLGVIVGSVALVGARS